jgi:hypothetical protein
VVHFKKASEDILQETPEVVEKDGTRHTEDGRELYADGNRTGWKWYVEVYWNGRLVLATENVQPPLVQEIGITVCGFDDGYQTCWRAV